ncbi:helix-turn-helix domain-containing protein [Flagellimonas olearia]|uniref:Helix-turn-helix domain-containing protein n=1 Tax=Flagellimonas olearia TaxID=552546 RepID=A0A6I1DYJ6_9FLAO|nr:helix-turn-helix domain-containing protein [Allomuricauda olearia]KAB7530358.1 helix-turn-helix domain-containing protein [Allomuricauda olearia]
MKKLNSLNTRYKPIQPTIKPSNNSVCYQEVKPEPTLRNVAYCYWQLKTNRSLEEQFIYRVVADGCIDIFFEVSKASESFVMGFCKKYTEFPLENSFNYIGIRFYPTMFPQLFHINAKELSNDVFELNLVVPALANYIKNRIHADMSLSQIAVLLNMYLIKVTSDTKFHLDDRLYRSLSLILEKQGVLKTEKELDTGISPRQLRRIFDYYIGTSPKTFSKVIQFQNILCAKPSAQSLRRNKIFYDMGYSDQAHFIRDFKNFYGVTPNKAFK